MTSWCLLLFPRALKAKRGERTALTLAEEGRRPSFTSETPTTVLASVLASRLGVPVERGRGAGLSGRSGDPPAVLPRSLLPTRILRTDFIPELSQASVATGKPGYPTLK